MNLFSIHSKYLLHLYNLTRTLNEKLTWIKNISNFSQIMYKKKEVKKRVQNSLNFYYILTFSSFKTHIWYIKIEIFFLLCLRISWCWTRICGQKCSVIVFNHIFKYLFIITDIQSAIICSYVIHLKKLSIQNIFS